MKLRPYQSKLIQDIRLQVAQGNKRIVCVMPTGAGKTVTLAEIIRLTLEKGGQAILIVHLDALVGQSADKLGKFGIKPGFIKAGWEEDRANPVQVASIQTMARRQWWKEWPPAVVIWDEAHISSFSKLGKRIVQEIWSDAIHLGLTATPLRLKRSEGMADLFNTLVMGPTTRDLQDHEPPCLVEMKYYSTPKKANLQKLSVLGGEYKSKDLSERVNTQEMIDDAIAQWFKLTPHKKTIVFCVDCDHARAVFAAFTEKGVESRLVLGGTTHRADLYKDFADGAFTVLVSVNVVAIGFDEPSVEVGLLLRPTKSKGLHIQQIGRVMRPSLGKEYGIILDQAGNCLVHGLPEDISQWSLDEAKDPEEAPKKECFSCNAILPAVAKVCPECGQEFESAGAKDASPTELERILPTAPAGREKEFEYYRRQRKQAYQLGRLPGLATARFKEHFGEHRWPSKSWALGAVFEGKASNEEKRKYFRFLMGFVKAGRKSQDWANKEFVIEFGRDEPLPTSKQIITCPACYSGRHKITASNGGVHAARRDCLDCGAFVEWVSKEEWARVSPALELAAR